MQATVAPSSEEHQAAKMKLEEATLPLMLDAMWAANVLDIETTLRHVCSQVPLRASGGEEVNR